MIAILCKPKYSKFSQRVISTLGDRNGATGNTFDNMSYAELSRIERLKIDKQNSERNQLRERIVAMVKEQGFEISDLFGRGRKGKSSVAVKYRDPQNPENTWTGRGRMPRWMVGATKGGKAKKEDFLA